MITLRPSSKYVKIFLFAIGCNEKVYLHAEASKGNVTGPLAEATTCDTKKITFETQP